MTRLHRSPWTLIVVRSIAAGVIALSASVAWGQGFSIPGGTWSPTNPTSGLYRSGADVIRQNTINRPTVSPFLNLLTPGGSVSTNYQTLVRPALEQQRINREQEFALNRLQQQFNAALQTSAARPQQGAGIRPTGHQTAFFYFSNFYPNLRPIR
jgi:hypothetical protein